MIQQIPISQPNFDDIFELWLPEWWESAWIWCAILVGIVLFLGSIWLLFCLYKRCKKQQRPVDSALQRIVTLKKRIIEEKVHETSTLHGKDFYVELFDIMKQYLAAAYGLNMESKTEYEVYYFLTTGERAHLPEMTEWAAVVATLIDRGMNIKYAQGCADRTAILNECEIVHTILSKSSQRNNKA